MTSESGSKSRAISSWWWASANRACGNKQLVAYQWWTVARVLAKVAKQLGLKKLNFQVLRRTTATLAQHKGGVKDVQEILAHTKPDLTAGVYMQPIAASVKRTLDAIYEGLTAPPKVAEVV